MTKPKDLVQKQPKGKYLLLKSTKKPKNSLGLSRKLKKKRKRRRR